MSTLELIEKAAQIPCFSSYEDVIHPWIEELVAHCPNATLEKVPLNNLFIRVEGDPQRPPIALSAHLDKIDHFGDQPSILPTDISETEITGQLDDTVGLGLCLSLMQQSQDQNFPTLYLLLSEMEESFGLRRHPERLKNGGEGLKAGMGASALSKHLLENHPLPAAVITLDTTPLFKGKPGLALYSKHWELNKLEASDQLKQATSQIEEFIQDQAPDIHLANNTNDYLHYGFELNQGAHTLPCIAIEPAIFPYHQKGEKVFLKDIEDSEKLVKTLLLEFDFSKLIP